MSKKVEKQIGQRKWIDSHDDLLIFYEREQKFLTKNVFDMKNSQQLVGLHSCGTIACVRACLSVCLYDFLNICLSVKGTEQANNNHVVATRIEMLTRVDIYKPQ